MSGIFVALSVVGILLGLFMINVGYTGGSLPSLFILVIGIFVFVKEILDILQSGH